MRRSPKHALEVPFREEWRKLLAERLTQWRRLTGAERSRLEDLIRVFRAGRMWEGPAGADVDEEVQVTVSAHASVLVMGLDLEWYRDVTSVIVHPATVVRRGTRHLGGGLATDTPARLHGEAVLHGPVMLTWDAVLAASQSDLTGRNVVHHEFAHKLDMRDGFADGEPPITPRADAADFAEVVSREYDAIIAGNDTVLDPYAATNRAEFFAVASEMYFARPDRLRAAHPDLFRVLRGFYGWDPPEEFDSGSV